MPKKKPIITENLTETPINEDNMEAPKPKKKRPISEKQKANFDKLQEANRVRYEARKKAKEELGEAPKTNKKNANDEILENKEEYINNEINKKTKQTKQKIVKEDTDSEEEAPTIIKKKHKKKKPKIVIEQDSSSDEEEIIIRRCKKNKSIKKQQQEEGYINDKQLQEQKQEINTEPLEEASVEKTRLPPPLKEYTHTQILKGLGL
tara:strand:- start:1277 stop:1894 length:618 start_codon:yes stop_codon:yes gene_type:complete